MEKVLGFFSPFFICIFIFILNALLPGRWVTGYVVKTGSTEKLRYRLNGLLVLAVVLIVWITLCYSGVLAWDWLYKYRWYTLAGAVTFGLIFSFAIILPFPAIKKSFLADFYLGRLENPQ